MTASTAVASRPVVTVAAPHSGKIKKPEGKGTPKHSVLKKKKKNETHKVK